MRRFVLLPAVAAVAISLSLSAAAAHATTYTKSVRYGPFSLPAAADPAAGTHASAVRLAVARPCLDCHITSFKPDLVYGDGSRATMANGAMLHHAVFTSQFRSDATCSGTWLGLAGERFFASGNERTAISFPSGYGYRVRWYDSWNLLVDVMNHSSEPKSVYLKVTYTYRPAWESVKRLKPVWLDIDQCGDSEYPIPAGYSDTYRDWSVNVPGKVMSAIGHVHGYGVAVEARNLSRGGETICRSEATLDPTNMHDVMEMGTCTGTPVAEIARGETVRLHSIYDSMHAADDVMGIMLLYVNPT
jgi:hypothetical protein